MRDARDGRVVACDVEIGRTTASDVARTVMASLGGGTTTSGAEGGGVGGAVARAALRGAGGRTLVGEDAVARCGETYELVMGRIGLFGGGGDGGSTGAESRSAYLEMYADPASRKKESLGGFVRYSSQSTVRDRDVAEEDLARWFTCAFTEEPLESGENAVVIDKLGALYNKEPVLKALRDKAVDGIPLPKRIEHITGMKALVTCKFSKRRGDALGENAATKSSAVNSRDFRSGAIDAVFACPITGLDFNGKTKFLVLRPSGVVVADKALREAKAAVEEMNDGLALADAPPPIPVNPRGEELEALKMMLEDEKAKKDGKKKTSKKDKSVEDENGAKRKVSSVDGASKKFKAVAPANADAEVYASIFTSSAKEDDKDNHFLARNARKAW